MSPHVPIPVSQISAEHSSWLRGIAFYQDETSIMKNRLDELSDQSAGMLYQGKLDTCDLDLFALQSAIETHVKHLESDVETRVDRITNTSMAEHDSMRDRYMALEKSINILRHDFNQFLVRAHHPEH